MFTNPIGAYRMFVTAVTNASKYDRAKKQQEELGEGLLQDPRRPDTFGDTPVDPAVAMSDELDAAYDGVVPGYTSVHNQPEATPSDVDMKTYALWNAEEVPAQNAGLALRSRIRGNFSSSLLGAITTNYIGQRVKGGTWDRNDDGTDPVANLPGKALNAATGALGAFVNSLIPAAGAQTVDVMEAAQQSLRERERAVVVPEARGLMAQSDTLEGGLQPEVQFDARQTQQALRDLGFNITVDGAFGQKSRRALGDYQSQIGLPASGVVDEVTYRALMAGRLVPMRELSAAEMNMPFAASLEGRALTQVESIYRNPYSLNRRTQYKDIERHNSGLTIGIGFDLGTKTRADLERMGLSDDLVDKLSNSGWLGLRPSNIVDQNDYLRTQGHAAMYEKFLEQREKGTLPTFTPSEIDQMVQAEYAQKERKVQIDFDSKGYPVKWENLLPETRAALLAEVYHRGSLGKNNRRLQFYNAAVNNDIETIAGLYGTEARASILNVLNTDDFKERREAEPERNALPVNDVNLRTVQEEVGTTPDGGMGPSTESSMRSYLQARDIDIPTNASRAELQQLVEQAMAM